MSDIKAMAEGVGVRHWFKDWNQSHIIAKVLRERVAQDERWGEQNHPDGASTAYKNARNLATDRCNTKRRDGVTDWAGILLEEVYEALSEYADSAKLRAELVQVAAVAVNWIESIDRRTNVKVAIDEAKSQTSEQKESH